MDKLNLDTIAEVTEVEGDIISFSRTPVVDQISRSELENQLLEKVEGIKSHQASIVTLNEEIAKMNEILDSANKVKPK